MNKILNKSAVFLSTLLLASPVFAEVQTFGGDAEQFKGDGDLVPPECTIDLPTVASTSFFVKWDCSDNNSPKAELRSELWIKTKGETISRKVKDFLGFPASIEVNEGLLKGLTETPKSTTDTESTQAESSFESYLPIEVRLIVRDKGGAAAISEVKSVLPGSSLACDISIKTESVAASGDSTGIPASEASASSVSAANSGGGLQSLNEFSFSSCDIEEICKDEPKYAFSINEAGAFALIGADSSLTGEGTLTKSDSASYSYTGTLTSNDSGDLSIDVTCK